MRSVLRLLPLAMLAAFSGCGGESAVTGPSVTIEPIEFGGEHHGLLGTMLGDSVMYSLRRSGPEAGAVVRVSIWHNGERAVQRALATFVLPADTEFDLAMLMLDPREQLGPGRKVESSRPRELFVALDFGGTRLHRSVPLPEWDALDGENEGTLFQERRERTTLPLAPDQPVVLWRWVRSDAVPAGPISGPRPDGMASVLEVTFEIKK